MADPMMLPAQHVGERPRTLADPSQRRLGIAARVGIDQSVQRQEQAGVRDGDPLATGTGPPHPARRELDPLFDLSNPARDRGSRQPTRSMDTGHSAIAQGQGFIGRKEAPGPSASRTCRAPRERSGNTSDARLLV